MILEYETLKFIWLLLVGALLIGFAITGGFDLGVAGALFMASKNDKERRLALASIGPTWEGNQVWFITAGGALFAAFPLMYAAAFSGFYIALLCVLLSLILRPPGLDYRNKLPSPLWRTSWDVCLFLSGFVPSLLFGVAFGNLFLGIAFYYDDNLMPHPTGSFFTLVSPYALLFGLVSLSIVLTHGALFLQLKTEAFLNQRAKKIAQWFGITFIISFSIAWAWTVFKIEGLQITSLPNPNESFTPLSKEVARGVGFWLKNYQEHALGYLAPFLSICSVLIALIFSVCNLPGMALFFNSIALSAVIITAGFTLYPFILPSSSHPNHSLTLWDAASSKLTLSWMLLATVIFLPIVLSYTIWVFRVMRGKVLEKDILKKNSLY